MPSSVIPASAATGVTSQSSVANRSSDLAGITGDDFMQILVKQLQMQDPFKPMGNEEMVRQISTIRELEMNTRMSRKLEQLTDQQRFGSAAALIGRNVQGTVKDGDGNEYKLEGIVTGIRFTESGEVMIELDTGETLPLTALEAVSNAQAATSQTTANDQPTAKGQTAARNIQVATPPAVLNLAF